MGSQIFCLNFFLKQLNILNEAVINDQRLLGVKWFLGVFFVSNLLCLRVTSHVPDYNCYKEIGGALRLKSTGPSIR